MKFEIHLFMGDKEVTREEMKKYAIRSNTVDRIVNRVCYCERKWRSILCCS